MIRAEGGVGSSELRKLGNPGSTILPGAGREPAAQALARELGADVVPYGGAQLLVVLYGGKIEVPTLRLVIEEVKIGGSLVGRDRARS